MAIISSDLCIGPTAKLVDQQSLPKINLFIVSDDFIEESEPANSHDLHLNIFLDTMLSETQCVVS